MIENQPKTNNIVNDVPTQSVDRVGILLANERKKKDVPLQEISQKLCIRTLYLDAIESGNYAELPPPPYSIGFVNSYARFLGLNADRMVQLFKEELNLASAAKKKSFVVEDISSEADMPSKRYILAGIILFLLTIGLWYFFSPVQPEQEVMLEEPEIVAAEVDPVMELDVIEVAPVEQSGDQVNIKDDKFEEKIAAPKAKIIEIKVSKADTWIEVKNDKKVITSTVMKAGDSYVFPEEKGLKISSGKIDGVEVFVDGVKKEVFTPKRRMNVELDEIINR